MHYRQLGYTRDKYGDFRMLDDDPELHALSALRTDRLWSLIDRAADHPQQYLSTADRREMEILMEEYYDEQEEWHQRAQLASMLDDGTPTWDVQGRL